MALVLVLLLTGASAFLVFQAAFQWRQRYLARERVLGGQLRAQSISFRTLYRAVSDLAREGGGWLDLRLPSTVKVPLARLLARAESSDSPGMLLGKSLLFAAGGLALGAVYGSFFLAAICAALAASLPLSRMRTLAAQRLHAMRRDLPDALDLLCVCVEAGLGFDPALARVADASPEGPLKRELRACVAGASLGAPRSQVLRSLADRVGLDEMSELVAALIQADRRGGPMGMTLRAQSAQLRALHSLRARGSAAKAPLKMLFPLMLFILPVVFIVLFGPLLMAWKAGGF